MRIRKGDACMWKLNSISAKLILPILAFILLAGLATSLVAQHIIRESLDLALREKGTAIARQIAVASSNDLLLENKNQLHDMLTHEQQSVSDLSYAFILDGQGNIMAHTFDAGVPLQLLWENYLPASEKIGIKLLEVDGEVVYDFAMAVYMDDQYRIGTVRVGLSRGNLETALASLRTSSTVITLALVLVGLLITCLLSASIVKPVRRLHRFSEQVAEGRYDTKVSLNRRGEESLNGTGGDEIVQLGRAFNHMIDTINDVTERLRDSNDVLASVLNTVPQCIFWKDLNGVYQGCNRAFVKFSEVPDEGDIIGKTAADLPVTSEQAVFYEAQDRQVAQEGPILHEIQVIKTSPDRRRWFDLSKIPMKDEQGRTCLILCVFEDITARIETEAELEEARLKVLRSEKLATIGQLASTIAHEIRNPLGVMKNVVYYLNMFDLGEFDAEVKENLDILSFEIDNSNKIVGDLLDFSRIKQPTLTPNNINTIVEAALGRLRFEKGVKLILELDPNLPVVEADAVQLQQAFYNIAANAVQAMEDGGTLTVRSRANVSQVEISFTDTGVGIAEKNLAAIFEPLFSTKTKGTGLGLALVASLVEGHQGRIDVTSSPGQGSTFTVVLPAERRAS